MPNQPLRTGNVNSAKKLAIQGGTPSIRLPIPDWPPRLPAIDESVGAALRDGSWGQYQAAPLERLRRLMEQRYCRQVWTCASGTIGVELALRGCGIGPGQEVIMAGYDFPGNFRAVEAVGATPVLVDVQPGHWIIDPGHIESALSDSTAALLASHLHGSLLDMSSLVSFCQAGEMALIEDACQVPGALQGDRPAGTFGDAGVFSFGGSKLLTAGRGGAVITGREDVYQRIKVVSERGNDAWPLSALQAAALVPQWEYLDQWNRQRLESVRRLGTAIESLDLFQTRVPPGSGTELPAYYKFPLLLPDGIDREPVIAALQAEGLPADAGFRGFWRRAPARCRACGELPNCRRAARQLILVHHPVLLGGEDLLEQVVEALVKVDSAFSGNHWMARP